MPRRLTIRGVPDEIARRLESLSQARGTSVNAVVLEILERAVGVDERRRRLARYVTWGPEDLEEFERALGGAANGRIPGIKLRLLRAGA